MNVVNSYSVEFTHLNKHCRISYTIQTMPWKKGFLMYRFGFPIGDGSKRELVIQKDSHGKFSTTSVHITKQQVHLLTSIVKAITRIERMGTQTIMVSPK